MKSINYAELQSWMAQNKPFNLLDVREEDERMTFNIGGEWIPLSKIMRWQPMTEEKKPIVVYCKRGMRSQIAIQRLESRFPDLDFYNLDKGILELL